jgi:hypothetical protein
VNDAEWIPLVNIPTRNMWRENPLAGLIPFAFTGGGDNWCWNTNAKTGNAEYEVLMCYRDDDFASAFAPDFPSWFYRTCLDYASGVADDPREIEEAREYLRLWANRLREIGPASMADHLESLARTDPSPSTRYFKGRGYSEFGFISHDDVARTVCERLGPSYVDRSVEWGSWG